MSQRRPGTRNTSKLFILFMLAAVVLYQFTAVQPAQGQTPFCDPAVQTCPTDTPVTCGLPGLPACVVNPQPTDAPTQDTTVYPTLTPSPTSTSTATVTPSAVPTQTLAPTGTPTPTATPKPWFQPRLSIKLPPPPLVMALVPLPNIQAFDVEITQAIQCMRNPNCPDNSVQLFIGKPTMVRLYVHLPQNSKWSAFYFIGGELCPGVHAEGGCSNPIRSINTVTVKRSAADISLYRGDINSTLNFILPASWTYGNFTAYVNMNGEDFAYEVNYKDNFKVLSFQEIPSQTLNVMFVPVRSNGYLADFNERWVLRDWLALTYPTSSIQVWQMSGIINNTDTYDWGDTSGGCGDGWGALLDDLDYYRGSNPQIFYGMVHQMTLKGTPYAGCGSMDSMVAAGEVNTGDRFGAETAAQEIGHTLQRNHAPGCSAGKPDMSYPNSTANIDEYGVDVVRRLVYTPSQSFDFMGYCGGEDVRWVSRYTYNALISLLPAGSLPGGQGVAASLPALPDGFGLAAPISFQMGGNGPQSISFNPSGNLPELSQAPAEAATLYLVGSGSITPQAVNLKRGFFLLDATTAAARTPETGPYTLDLLDAQGKVLSSLPFIPQSESNGESGDTGTFHLTIPWVQGAKGYQFTYNGAVIASATADSHKPSVENITSPGGSHWASTGTITLNWTPVYSGANPLQYLVQYSQDGGSTWSMLAVGLDQPTLDINAALVPGTTQGRVRVTVSDGFNTGEAVSAPFSADAKPPEVHIGWTDDGAQVKASQPVFLSGAATDAQDGPISGADLHWTVDSSPAGNGDSLVPTDLSVGEHVITLAATNAAGLTGTDSLHVNILPADPVPAAYGELTTFYGLLLWAIFPAAILLLVLAFLLLRKKLRRR